jgi:uncharacterized membrane protein YebE (DUF533 family)
MTQPRPTGPRRSFAFNTMVLAALIALLVIAGVVVWNWWSADRVSAADNSQDALVQPATLPPPGPAAVPARPARPDAPGDPSGDAVARGEEAERVRP